MEVAVSLRGRSFISLHEYDTEELHTILRLASRLKDDLRMGKREPLLNGRTLGMIFQKSSTRTRVSFEAGMTQLGGHALFLSSQDLQLNRGETVADTARVLGRYVDAIMARTYAHADVEQLAQHSGVPVINGLSDLLHPCQAMADLLTIQEKKGRLAGIQLAYVGDSNNVTHSLMQAGARMGMHVRVGSPAGFGPDAEVLSRARRMAARSGATIELDEDPVAAVRDADVVYADTWASMGQEAEREARIEALSPYQVNEALLRHASDDVIFMHCLPAHRGEEVTADVIDGPRSAVIDEAENRLHVQKAILALLLAA
ncbi:MAG: ornithine carbamoyltransferase [Candidatus Latescibacterota bacterium]|nr:MAG: ornithine carbamoyltransferase [Candidatus Latescibacterota bacterium]